MTANAWVWASAAGIAVALAPGCRSVEHAVSLASAEPTAADVRGEAEAIGSAHPWAGYYYGGDSLRGAKLWISPDGALEFQTWKGSFHWQEVHPGRVTAVEEDRLPLAIGDVPPRAQGAVTGEMIRVRWSGRHYLVASEEMEDFCMRVRLGWRFGNRFLLRPDERELPLRGLPEVPEAWRELLPSRRVCARVIDVRKEGEVESFAQGGAGRIRLVLTLDAGSEQGVQEGVYLKRLGGHPDDRYVVRSVAAERSEVAVTLHLPWMEDVWPEVGWELSSVYHDGPE